MPWTKKSFDARGLVHVTAPSSHSPCSSRSPPRCIPLRTCDRVTVTQLLPVLATRYTCAGLQLCTGAAPFMSHLYTLLYIHPCLFHQHASGCSCREYARHTEPLHVRAHQLCKRCARSSDCYAGTSPVFSRCTFWLITERCHAAVDRHYHPEHGTRASLTN